MEEGGGTGLLGNCWLVVAAITEVLMITPESVSTMTGLDGMPVPIVLDRVTEASVVLKARPVEKSTAAYPVAIWMAYSLAVPPPDVQEMIAVGMKLEKNTTLLKTSADARTFSVAPNLKYHP